MASIRKRGSNSYLIVVSRGYDYEGNRLKSVQKTVKPPKEYTPKQAEKWVKEQAILFEREVQHTPEPMNRSITLAKYIEHWVSDIGPKKLADSTYQRDLQDIRRILPALGNYKLTDLRKEVIREFYEEMRHTPRLDGRGNLSEKSVEGLHNTLCGILSAAVSEKCYLCAYFLGFVKTSVGRVFQDRKSTRLNSSHRLESRMPSSA